MKDLAKEIARIASFLSEAGEGMDFQEKKQQQVSGKESNYSEFDPELMAGKKRKASNFDPKSIAEKENMGPKVEQGIKNKANYNWYARFKSQDGRGSAVKTSAAAYPQAAVDKLVADLSRQGGHVEKVTPDGDLAILVQLKDRGGYFKEDTYDWDRMLGMFVKRRGKMSSSDFSDIARELRAIAKEANFNPETLGKKENTGKAPEDHIKNRATFDWFADFKSQQGPIDIPKEWKPETPEAVERHVKQVYKNQDQNSDFYPKVGESKKAQVRIRNR